jgi:4-hydroxy-4-methyl-2-oxoglutarate aldolase
MPARSNVDRGRPDPPPPEMLDELKSYEIAWYADAIGLNVMDPGLRALHKVSRIVGPAITVSTQPGDCGLMPYALELCRPGEILVIAGRGATDRACWGDYFSGWSQSFGLEGTIVDGASRDSEGIAAIDYPVFARGLSPYGPTLHGASEVNVPVSCGGVPVLPGDIIVADNEGIIVIPLRNLSGALASVRAKVETDRATMPEPSLRADYLRFYKRGGFEQRDDIDIHDSAWSD